MLVCAAISVSCYDCGWGSCLSVQLFQSPVMTVDGAHACLCSYFSPVMTVDGAMLVCAAISVSCYDCGWGSCLSVQLFQSPVMTVDGLMLVCAAISVSCYYCGWAHACLCSYFSPVMTVDGAHACLCSYFSLLL